MCNAWNHSPGCTCGWGGHGTTSPSHSTLRLAASISPNLLTSYTIPNASCPVCGTSVFFYVSPHGGRVFFDELGPPWPKHSCTDVGDSVFAPSEALTILYKWQEDGWVPLRITSWTRQDQQLIVLVGSLDSEPIRLYLRHPANRPMQKWVLAHARSVSQTKLQISALCSKGRETRFLASTHSFEAREL